MPVTEEDRFKVVLEGRSPRVESHAKKWLRGVLPQHHIQKEQISEDGTKINLSLAPQDLGEIRKHLAEGAPKWLFRATLPSERDPLIIETIGGPAFAEAQKRLGRSRGLSLLVSKLPSQPPSSRSRSRR